MRPKTPTSQARACSNGTTSSEPAQFDKALDLNPSNQDYARASAITREHRVTELVQQSGKARLLGQTKKAEALLAEAGCLTRRIGSSLSTSARYASGHIQCPAGISIGAMDKASPAIAGPITFTPDSGMKELPYPRRFQAALQQVVSSYGIRPVFDDSVAHQDPSLQSRISPLPAGHSRSLRDGGLFAVPLDSKSILIAQDTPENRQRLERQLQETISIPGDDFAGD